MGHARENNEPYLSASFGWQLKNKISKYLNILSKSESVQFSLIESVICLFTDSSVNKIFSTVKSVTLHWNNQWNLTDLQ